MAILMTGGTGYIGSHTCALLTEHGKEIVIVDNLSNSSREVLNRIRRITGSEPVFYHGNFNDTGILNRIFSENKIDFVIHFGGLKAVGESIQQPLHYYKNNVSGTVNLLQAMERHNVYNLVFSSSATVYGLPKTNPIKVNFPRSATNPYGRTKLIIENIIEDLDSRKWNTVILRYFNPIGAHPSGLMGENPLGEPNNLVPIVLKVASKEIPNLLVFGNDYDTHDGTAIRDYIHVLDLAEAHINAIDYISSKAPGLSIFNLGTGNPHSVLQIIDKFYQINSIRIPYKVVARRPGDVGECWADPTESQDYLAWRSRFTIEEMLKHAWNWKVNNPTGYIH